LSNAVGKDSKNEESKEITDFFNDEEKREDIKRMME